MQTLYYFISVLIILNKMIFVLFVMAYYLMLYILRKYNHFIGLIVFTLMCSLFFLCSLKMTVFFMLNLILLMCFEYLHFLFTFDHYFMNICTSLWSCFIVKILLLADYRMILLCSMWNLKVLLFYFYCLELTFFEGKSLANMAIYF